MRTVTLLAAAALAAAGCAGAPGADLADRVAEIRDAREAYAEPASALGTAARAVGAQVAEVRTGEAPPAERLTTIARIREELLPELDAATRLVVAAPTAGPDVGNALAAWEDALAAAEELLADAGRALDRAQLLAEVDRDLAAVVDVWDEAGSYSEQLDRFAAARDRALAIRERLSGLEPSPDCSDALARRIAAADHVAEVSAELRGLVEQRRGEAFDARLDELTDDPFGGTRLGGVAAGCWNTSQVATSAASVGVALDRLESRLNPSDIRTPS